MTAFLGSLHPALVHFPIALVVTAVLAELLRSRSEKSSLGATSRFMLAVAAAFAIPAAALGFVAAARPFEADVASAVAVHRVLGVVAAGLTAVTAGLAHAAGRNGEPWRVGLYRALLVGTLIAMVIAGHFGATVAHGPGYLSWR